MDIVAEQLIPGVATPFGTVLALTNFEPAEPSQWPLRLQTFPLPMQGRPVISQLRSRNAGRLLTQFERHQGACHVFIPLADTDLILVLASHIEKPLQAMPFTCRMVWPFCFSQGCGTPRLPWSRAETAVTYW